MDLKETKKRGKRRQHAPPWQAATAEVATAAAAMAAAATAEVAGVAACFTRPERPGEGSITSCDSFQT